MKSFKEQLNEAKREVYDDIKALEVYKAIKDNPKQQLMVDREGVEQRIIMDRKGMYIVYFNYEGNPMTVIRNPDKKDMLEFKSSMQSKDLDESTLNEYTFITRLVNDYREVLQKKFPKMNIEYIKFNDYDIDPVREVFEIDIGHDGKLVYFVGRNNAVYYDIERDKKIKYGKKQTKVKS